jgi:methylthioribose-1-phosphate isomerase
MTDVMRTVYWDNGAVAMIDQTLIPDDVKILRFTNYVDVVNSIKVMQIRGAPAIGVAAALGMALAAQSIQADTYEDFMRKFELAAEEFRISRPTAVNLFWAVNRMMQIAASVPSLTDVRQRLLAEAIDIQEEDIAINKMIGENGAQLINQNDTILTHCNAGALAAAGYGTALGVIRAAHESGKSIKVIADETRPRLQGMRLTAWELVQEGIPVSVISDNMAAWAMSKGMVNCVIVGADRIAANGDTANKIGTLGVGNLAKTYNIPFYVAAPVSTIDFALADGSGIPIEERSSDEVTHINGIRIAPEGVGIYNPSFDVTPAEYISGIITEQGVLYPPYAISIGCLKN